jgi:hypothetical protein
VLWVGLQNDVNQERNEGICSLVRRDVSNQTWIARINDMPLTV